ncbi:MAG TPA: VCBS repeat-containing protein, partial [Nitrospiria bacterium]|nr:VCBS repeat-containing protein [Nitrospiria bacterium]
MRRYAFLHFLALITLLDLSASCERKNPNADRMKDLFLSPSEYLVGANPTSVTAADFNRDGNLDLITTNVGDDSLSFLQGNGDGTFQNEVKIQVGNQPRTLAVGDFNEDGKLDLALSLIGNDSEVV